MAIDGTSWTTLSSAEVLARLAAAETSLTIIAIDGRSRSGKSTLAAQLAAAQDGVAVVHTDDIAWHHSFFEWTDVLIDNVLAPLRRRGPAVSFTPASWMERGREGAITVPTDTQIVLVEGVGSSRSELRPWLDASIWMDTPAGLAMRRTRELDRDPPGFVADWMRAENGHLDRDRPWERATLIVSGEHHPAAPGLHSVRDRLER